MNYIDRGHLEKHLNENCKGWFRLIDFLNYLNSEYVLDNVKNKMLKILNNNDFPDIFSQMNISAPNMAINILYSSEYLSVILNKCNDVNKIIEIMDFCLNKAIIEWFDIVNMQRDKIK